MTPVHLWRRIVTQWIVPYAWVTVVSIVGAWLMILAWPGAARSAPEPKGPAYGAVVLHLTTTRTGLQLPIVDVIALQQPSGDFTITQRNIDTLPDGTRQERYGEQTLAKN